MLRNSAVHGIESGDVRKANTKDDVGIVRVDFRKSGDGYELVFEDDGRRHLPGYAQGRGDQEADHHRG